jgi:hexosaminidase
MHKLIQRYALLSVLAMVGLTLLPLQAQEPASLIPKPVSMTTADHTFVWTAETQIYVPKGRNRVRKVAALFADLIAPATGFKPNIKVLKRGDEKGLILQLNKTLTDLGAEGYKLDIKAETVTLTAAKPAGLFRGLQTVRQMLPARIESDTVQKGPWRIVGGTVTDYPQYGHRGAMLDVARHFFSVADVKQVIDYLAAYKMNVLHLHLSDDQGWRIEIKSWPKLTEVGSLTQVGGGKGGFYTQKEYKEIVQYAKDRYITIVPEIEMPGHINAALVAYPELNGNTKPATPHTGIEVGFSCVAMDKEVTYKFIDDVIREVAAMTPGQYIHIGGDEVPKKNMKTSFAQFITKVQTIVQSHDKKMMGWADIAKGDIDKETVTQFWKKEAADAKLAVGKKARILMSPAYRAYLDMKYSPDCVLGLNWAGYIGVQTAYEWTLSGIVPGIPKEQIIGVEAPLWTETIKTMDDIEFMVFPRLLGYAELGWSPDNENTWDEYKVRLGKQKKRFELMGINYHKTPQVPWQDVKTD